MSKKPKNLHMSNTCYCHDTGIKTRQIATHQSVCFHLNSSILFHVFSTTKKHNSNIPRGFCSQLTSITVKTSWKKPKYTCFTPSQKASLAAALAAKQQQSVHAFLGSSALAWKTRACAVKWREKSSYLSTLNRRQRAPAAN